MNEPRVRLLEDRRDRIVADLRALGDQVVAEEIGAATADDLRHRYEVDLADILAELGAARDEPATGRSKRRVALGLGAFALAASVAVIGLANAIDPDPAPADQGVDLSQVTNEQLEEVVAANPDVVPMRLALARRYVEEGDFSAALPHYLYIVERGPNAEALMYLGWMTYLSGEAETGASLLEHSVELDPGNLLARWFLANVRYYGLDDRLGAVPLLEAVIDSGEAPADIAAEAQRMIDEAGP